MLTTIMKSKSGIFICILIFLLSLTVVAQKNTTLTYCLPETFCFSGDNYSIGKVTFGSINNFSGCINNGYGDYTQSVPVATVNAATGILAYVAINNGTASHVAIWIDYNQNEEFDTTEYTYLGNQSGVFGYVLIPATALAGVTKMRVRNSVGTMINPQDACRSLPYGETEDYSVNILPAPVAIIYKPVFSDTLYQNKIDFTSTITHNGNGIDTSNLLRPRIWAKKYGSAVWKSFQGKMISGTNKNGDWKFTIDHDSLGIRRNSCDSVQYYFVAQDTGSSFFIGYLPFYNTSHSNVNTQLTPPKTPFGYRIKPRLKDTVFVSSHDCRYLSLTRENGLFKEINLRGLEGDLNVVIETDLTEDGTYEINGASLNGHKLTISSAGDSVWTISNSPGYHPLFNLNAAKGVTIDGSRNGTGRYLRMTYQSDYYFNDISAIIKIYNSCDSITIKNMIFSNIPYTNYQEEAPIWVSAGNNKNILIENNLFQNMSNRLPYWFITSVNGNNEATVRNNEFKNFALAGIWLDSFSRNWHIDSNHFYRTPSVSGLSQSGCSAIKIGGHAHKVTNNYIGGSLPFCTGTSMLFTNSTDFEVIGIQITPTYGTDTILVKANKINNIEIATNSAYSFTGIKCESNNANIINNVIGNEKGTDTGIACFAGYIFGIVKQGFQSANIIDNIIASVKNKVSVSYSTTNIFGIYGINSDIYGFRSTNANTVVKGNKIYNINNLLNSGTVGIELHYGLVNVIENNILHDITCNGNIVTGIALHSYDVANTSSISRNRIYRLLNFAPSDCCDIDDNGDAITGIDINFQKGKLTVANNQLALDNDKQAAAVNIRGIYENLGKQDEVPLQEVIYNSVYIGGVSANNAGSAAFVSRVSPVKSIRNNIFYNERTGGTAGHLGYKIYTTTPEVIFSGTTLSNNLYIVNDTASFSNWSYMPRINWSDWKMKTRDSLSYITFPNNINATLFFTNKDSGNLNINNSDGICWYVNGKGLPIPQVTSDFDGLNVRSASVQNGSTDIGADEFITDTRPPRLVVFGKHAKNGADTLSVANKIVAIIKWGDTGVLPNIDSSRWYSGQWPPDTTNGGKSSNARVMNGWWEIYASGGSGYSYTISLFYDSSNIGKIKNINRSVIFKRDTKLPGSWKMLLPSVTHSISNSINAGWLNSFSSFTAGDEDAPLSEAGMSVCTGTSASFKTWNTGTNYTYQWQINYGSGFTNLNNSAVYNGVADSVLNIVLVSDSLAGRIYRCISNNGSLLELSHEYVIRTINTWTGNGDTNWNNSLNWSCGIVPELNTDVIIQSGALRYPSVVSTVFCRSLILGSGSSVNVNAGGKIILSK